jgi:maltooligosyltrehalose trehalohydrolase
MNKSWATDSALFAASAGLSDIRGEQSMMMAEEQLVQRAGRRLPVGAEVLPRGGVDFRVWAPRRGSVEVVLGDGRRFPLDREEGGYYSGHVAEAAAGTLYRYRLDGDDRLLLPDPSSRFQPEGPHGPSQVIDPLAFQWSDGGWPGAKREGQVIYEMHIGTFTPEGTYASAMRELAELANLGITVLEIMPLAEFPGRFGWGYDGVDLYAPTRLYGQPDDLRRFVDHAHRVGLGVILDVVYNHVGPDGSYLKEYSDDYFTDKYENEWGEAINFDGADAAPVREFFIANAGYWIDEFHMDGLRLDATQSIHDASPEHVILAVGRRARQAAGRRSIILVAENEPQHSELVKPAAEGGCELDMLWNDDFHHSATVAMTGGNEAYYHDHLGRPQEFVSAAKYGYLYQGQLYAWQGKRRGTPAFGLPAAAFVNFIENHDQVANSARGQRCHQLTSPGRYRAMTALMLLMPGTPMLFQGQEFGASTPFLFFADHHRELAAQVRSGRADFLAQFSTIATPETFAQLADPGDEETFKSCRLDLGERERHAPIYAMHRDLLRLRREDAVLSGQHAVDGAVLGPDAFLLRYFGPAGDDRLLIVNLGLRLELAVAPEPLVAPPRGKRWTKAWSSEEPAYGGSGTPPLETEDNWVIPGHAAVLLRPAPMTDEQRAKEARLEQETAVKRKRQKQEALAAQRSRPE